MAIEVGAARRRIIRRPRLTSILDGSTARIRMLVAPAGYGKTTLAREWLGEPERRDVWYRGGQASIDVAALADGFTEAVRNVIPDAGHRMLDRLRATGQAEEDVDVLVELFAEDLESWPSDAWLAFDDYQFAIGSAASERFVDLLTQHAPIQMLITSRVRPTWASARRILYGEILEIDRRALAMDDAEAREVIDRDEPGLADLLELVRGWPAVIGLLRLNMRIGDTPDALPDQLYDYFAQELYQVLPESVRIPLGELAFARTFDREFAEMLLGRRATRVIEAGLRVGVIAESERDTFEIHPLFVQLLHERAFPLKDSRRRAAARVGHGLVEMDRWDDAVDVAARFELPDVLTAAMERALYRLIDLGRISTVTRWLNLAAALHSDSAILDLAEAEVAFRHGEHTNAEVRAAQAAKRLNENSRFFARALVRAGHGALLANREEESIDYFKRAADTATAPVEQREALFGLYSALSELERPEAASVLAKAQDVPSETPDDLLRSLAISLTHAVRAGGIHNALASAEEQFRLVERVADPLKRTSFLHAFSSGLTMAGQYRRSLEVATELHELADEHRLDFVRPFALIDQGVARIGLRQFALANQDIVLAARTVRREGDVHIEGNLAAIRCRLLICLGRPRDAAAAASTTFHARSPTSPLLAEILAARALALACDSDFAAALKTLEMAEQVSLSSLEVQVLAPAIRAICSLPSPESVALANEAWSVALTTGNVNSFVCAYRGCPELLSLCDSLDPDLIGSVLISANDTGLAKNSGIALGSSDRPPRSPLTARETEVMDLAATGLSNKEIAQMLFVSDATIKVHLRHIYEKLGVRGRSEAVARWLTRQ